MMNVATVYFLDGNIATDGLQSELVCNDAIRQARWIARDHGRSVVVEDVPARRCYRVTPKGHIWRAPKSWTPTWNAE